MIGYMAPNNDLFFFFEDAEINLLARNKIEGYFVNIKNPEKIVPLEILINNKISERVKTNGEKDSENNFIRYSLMMRQKDYEKFNECRKYGLHEGFRHVNLIDIKNMEFSDELNYNQLCFYRKKYLNL